MIKIIKLIRPINGIIGGGCVVLGGIIAEGGVGWELILGGVICFLIMGGGNTINDVLDLKIDKINKPQKVVIETKKEKITTWIIGIILIGIGVGLSSILGDEILFITIGITALLLGYNFKFKKYCIVGNVIIAVLGGMPFIYGAIIGGNFVRGMIPFGFAFLLHMGREILKDIEDAKGDKVGGIISITIKYGEKTAIKVVTGVLFLLIVGTFLPFVFNLYGKYYLIGVILGVNLPVGIITYKLLHKPSYSSVAGRWLKICMMIGMGALGVSRIK